MRMKQLFASMIIGSSAILAIDRHAGGRHDRRRRDLSVPNLRQMG